MRKHKLHIKINGKWLKLYTGNQLSHMERYADGLKAQGKEVFIKSEPKKKRHPR